MNLIFRIILLCALTATAGCKETLYSNLTEREANRMMAVLQASNVHSTRKIGADGGHDLLVSTEDIAVASTLLEAQGLPRETFKRMDEIFAAEGLVGTPFEERVRYVFALEQKLTENLTSINGVRSVRVSINIPEQARFGAEVLSSSASVIVHHELNFDPQDVVPKIKVHMSNAVPNLEYGEVAVVMFPAGGANVQAIAKPQPFASVQAATSTDDQPTVKLASTLVLPSNINNTTPIIVALIVLTSLWLILKLVLNLFRGANSARRFNARL